MLFGLPFRHQLPVLEVPEAAGPLEIEIDVPGLCRRFSTAKVSAAVVADSPRWLQRRLALSGIEPINNVVDASNYVMLELGQPTHMYDARRLPSPRLGVRTGRDGESLVVLGEKPGDEPVRVSEKELVIVSGDQPVAVAGIIGGLDTAVHDGTTDLQIESANFDFIAIRQSQARLNVYTEASSRFSRGVDPALTLAGIARLLEILRMTAPSLEVTHFSDWADFRAEPLPIELRLEGLNAALGTRLSLDEVATKLTQLGIDCRVDPGQASLTALVTSARADLQQVEDLYEEVVRLYGYDRLPTTMPAEPIPMHRRNRRRALRERARDGAVRWGLQEVITYSLTSQAIEDHLEMNRPDAVASDRLYVAVINPVSPERSVMRRTLVPGLLQAVRDNLRYSESCHVFEIGNVFHPESAATGSRLPAEPLRVAIAMVGPVTEATVHDRNPRPADLFDLADAIGSLAASGLRVPDTRFDPGGCSWLQPGATFQHMGNGRGYGRGGKVHPLVLEHFDLGNRAVFAAELDLDALLDDAPEVVRFRELPRQPSIEIDITAIVADDVPARSLAETGRASAGPLAVAVAIVDVYRGMPIPDGQKAVTLRLVLNARTRTLGMEEARQVREVVVDALRQRMGAVIDEAAG